MNETLKYCEEVMTGETKEDLLRDEDDKWLTNFASSMHGIIIIYLSFIIGMWALLHYIVKVAGDYLLLVPFLVYPLHMLFKYLKTKLHSLKMLKRKKRYEISNEKVEFERIKFAVGLVETAEITIMEKDIKFEKHPILGIHLYTATLNDEEVYVAPHLISLLKPRQRNFEGPGHTYVVKHELGYATFVTVDDPLTQSFKGFLARNPVASNIINSALSSQKKKNK